MTSGRSRTSKFVLVPLIVPLTITGLLPSMVSQAGGTEPGPPAAVQNAQTPPSVPVVPVVAAAPVQATVALSPAPVPMALRAGQFGGSSPLQAGLPALTALLDDALLAPPPLPPPPPPPPPPPAEPPVALDPSDASLAALRWCEAGGDYTAVSAGGWYRGAYQFDFETWDSVASRHYPYLVGADPAAAAPAEQDAMARALYAERGWAPWPVCAP